MGLICVRRLQNPLEIYPVVHLQYNTTIGGRPDVCGVVICIDDEDVTQWFESPLEATVDIEVFELGVVLEEGSPEDISGEVDLYTWTNQEELTFSKVAGKGKSVINKVHGEVTPWLGAIL